jgi:hypothetical protein
VTLAGINDYARQVVDASLLTEELKALIGQAGDPVEVLVTPTGVRRAREVFEGAPGQTPGQGEAVEGFVIAGLETSSGQPRTPDVMPNSVLISNEWEFQRPLRVGDRLYARARLADISERLGGQFGYSLYFRTEVELTDADGGAVARTATTLMQYDARNARGEPQE